MTVGILAIGYVWYSDWWIRFRLAHPSLQHINVITWTHATGQCFMSLDGNYTVSQKHATKSLPYNLNSSPFSILIQLSCKVLL